MTSPALSRILNACTALGEFQRANPILAVIAEWDRVRLAVGDEAADEFLCRTSAERKRRIGEALGRIDVDAAREMEAV